MVSSGFRNAGTAFKNQNHKNQKPSPSTVCQSKHLSPPTHGMETESPAPECICAIELFMNGFPQSHPFHCLSRSTLICLDLSLTDLTSVPYDSMLGRRMEPVVEIAFSSLLEASMISGF